tara:strand:+ start:2925 stop:3143 length:219 start_codon:yes stop_codon:yes gene_type:complete
MERKTNNREVPNHVNQIVDSAMGNYNILYMVDNIKTDCKLSDYENILTVLFEEIQIRDEFIEEQGLKLKSLQ